MKLDASSPSALSARAVAARSSLQTTELHQVLTHCYRQALARLGHGVHAWAGPAIVDRNRHAAFAGWLIPGMGKSDAWMHLDLAGCTDASSLSCILIRSRSVGVNEGALIDRGMFSTRTCTPAYKATTSRVALRCRCTLPLTRLRRLRRRSSAAVRMHLELVQSADSETS